MVEVSHIKPFLESVESLYDTMLDSKIKAGKVSYFKSSDFRQDDLTMVISIAGEIKTTTMAITFPKPTAISLVGALLGMPVEEDDSGTIVDGLGEVSNIVGGGAKAKFQQEGVPMDLSLPHFLRGPQDEILKFTSNTQWIDIPFQSDLGNFSMRVCTYKNGKS